MSHRARARTSLFGLGLLFLAFPLWLATRGSASGSNNGSTNGATNSGVMSGFIAPSPAPIAAASRADTDAAGFVVPADFPATLIRASLDPAALAAGGVQSAGVGAVLQAAADVINANPTALPNADAAIASARPDVDRLEALIHSGLAAQEDLTAFQTATSALATGMTQRQTALDNIFNGAIANLSAGQRTVITQIRANRAVEFSRDFPTEFLAIDRSQETWVNVRECLANEHIAVKHPETLDQGEQSQLATWRANQTVSAAKNALDANLATVTTAWNTAAGIGQ
jgi:hypothetical protein